MENPRNFTVEWKDNTQSMGISFTLEEDKFMIKEHNICIEVAFSDLDTQIEQEAKKRDELMGTAIRKIEVTQKQLDTYRNATHINVPEDYTSIGRMAFWCFEKLSSIDLPPSLTHIGDQAFVGCKSLTSITLPPSLTHIGDLAFAGCTSLSSISLPPSLTRLGDGAFYGCTRLTSITLPPSLTHIGDRAFAGCTRLTSITLPPSLTRIENQAFVGCKSLKTILTSQALNQNIRATLPPGVNVITIETLIPSLAGATPEQIGVVLSLIDLDRSSFDQPPTLRLREEALQQMPKETLIKTFPSFSVRQLRELLSLNDSTYKPLYETLFKPFLQISDDSNDFLLPILEHLPLKDLAKFLATTQNPLAGLLASEKATTMEPNSLFSSLSSRVSPVTRRFTRARKS